MSRYKIVCVDDEQDILDYLKAVIEGFGYQTETFTDPLEAVKYIKDNSKLVLMVCSDFNMPEIDGYKFRAKLLEEGLEHPFVVLTGFYTKELAVEAMRLQISEFVEKPLVIDNFKAIIQKYAGKRLAVLEEEREMISDFLEETSPMLDEIEGLILELEENPEDENAVNTYFRLLHTIKGTSSCIGLNQLATFAHRYEDLINLVKSKELSVNSSVINVLLKGSDYLKQMYQCEQNFEVFPEQIEEIVKIFDQDFSSKSDSSTSSFEDKEEVKKESHSSSGGGKDEKISISVDVLSHFLEMSGELTVLKNTIFKILTKMTAKCAGDTDLEQLTVTMTELHKVSSLLQNQVSEMKKISIDSVFKPMKRVVRDSAKTCDKNVRFETSGEHMRVDTSVGKLLNSVLVHMLRNSVDHGIEAPEKRQELGKPSEGLINLKCSETGESIIVEIEDDGNGINAEKIKQKALEKELYTASELEKMSKNRVYQILFESGFSTAEKITAVSGRGVGMDMVKSSIEEFGGKIFIDSEVGKGSKFVLDIPIPRSVLIIKSLMVYSKRIPFNIPLDDVEKVVLYEEAKEEEIIQDVEGKKILRYHDRLIPLIELRDVMQLEARNRFDIFNIVIVRGDGYCYGIVVDEIEDIEEVVVKKLSHPLNHSGMFQGVTFVGDGELGLILDVKGIADSLGIKPKYQEEEKFSNTFAQGDEIEYMQFNLMGHKHYCIPLKNVYRLEVIQSKNVEYSGDMPLLKYREGTLPLMLFENELGLEKICLKEFLSQRESVDVIVVEMQGHKRGFLINEINDIIKSYEAVDTQMSDKELIAGTVYISEHTNTVIDIEKLMLKYRPKVIKLEADKADKKNQNTENFKQAS